MSLRNLIHTIFFAVYVVFNVAVYQFVQQIQFSALSVFVLAPLAIIVEAGVLFAMDAILVKALCPAEQTEMSVGEQMTFQKAGLFAHAAFVQGVSYDRRSNTGKLWNGKKDRRHSMNTPLGV